MKRRRRKRHYKKLVERGFKSSTKDTRIYFGNGERVGFLPIKALASFVPEIIVC